MPGAGASGLPSSRLLLHPLPLLAVALLVVNDHVLKPRWPGALTGKLSDAAGMVYFPLFLHALLAPAGRLLGLTERRVLLGCVLATGLVFAAIKTLPAATEVYRVSLGALQWPFRALVSALARGPLPSVAPVSAVTDPTDLLALPLLLLPWRLGGAQPGVR